VSRSYRLGVQIVAGTLLISASLCLAVVGRAPAPASRAGQDLGAGAFPLGSFQLEASSGRIVTQADLSERVWISAFVFTRCPLSCPRISSAMKGLQSRLARTNVLLVSISVDPEYDTPPILAAYAQRFGALEDRWWFLTGSKSSVHELIQKQFKLALAETTAADRDEGAEMISHSDRLALVDRGQIVGFFDSSDGESLDALVAEASRRALPGWVRFLPTVNASLNGLCAGLLLVGWILIRWRHALDVGPNFIQEVIEFVGRIFILRRPAPFREKFVSSADPARELPLILRPAVRAHATCMLLAVTASTLFLTSYLVYHGQAGSVSFRHGGWLRIVYFTILLSHTALATLGVVPLVILTLIRALRHDYQKHAQIAQVTFPIWLYVSVTGVVIYLMLYHFPMHASMSAMS
jgi:protein SCO1